jgi:hypothetical protein
MKKTYFIFIISILIAISPAKAQDINSKACKHRTTDCYEANADMDYEVLTIYFADKTSKVLDIDTTFPDDLSAYDPDTKTYYDIDIIY